jgi:riboflavin kinase/FMN adenylyltransferase
MTTGGGLRSVITLESFAEVPAPVRGAYLAIGNFDGVHRGHAHLIGRLRALADQAGAPALALTVDPPPVVVLRPENAPPPLTWIERKVALLKQAGATEVGVFQTGRWLLGLTAREFFERVVLGQFAAKGMVEGPTFGFGRDRGGDAQLLGSWCAEAGLGFEIASPTVLDGQIISSSRIRQCLAEGQTDAAAELLGRPHRLRGLVVRGAGRGSGLGFPTANLDQIEAQIPADGVYAARVFIDGQCVAHAAAAHIGPNATFGEQTRAVEVHLIEFQGDLYGRRIELDLLRRLRTTRKFDNVNDLMDQIQDDVDQAKALARA